MNWIDIERGPATVDLMLRYRDSPEYNREKLQLALVKARMLA